MNCYRQGDVILIQVSALPDGLTEHKPADRVVLAYGEVTGHAHAIKPSEVRAWSRGPVFDAGAERYIQSLGGATVVHEEHTPITVPAGLYRVAIQQEYSPAALRNVAD